MVWFELPLVTAIGEIAKWCQFYEGQSQGNMVYFFATKS